MRPLIRTAVAGLALLLGACTGSVQEPTPTPSSPTPTASSASPTPKPSPTPPPTLDPDQTAARDVVLKYAELINEFGMDSARTDVTPLAGITTGVAQRIMLATLDSYRERGVQQAAPFDVTLASVGVPVQDASGAITIIVTLCLDSTNVDSVSRATGQSVLTADRDAVHDFAYDVVRETETAKWLISDVAVTPVRGCR